ncbi:MAG TPA: LLM class flavin-dependent oxidoreductase [Solirubrobacteraceae bacterium]
MRFGCSFWLDRDPRQAARLARVAEDAGFEDVWFPDHYFIREVYAALALAAAATRRIRLGTGVTSPHLRHPVLLASAAATIDEISDGRSILGLGVGGYEFPTQLDVSLARPLAVCRDATDVVRRLLAGETVTTDGKIFAVRGARLHFTPVHRLPIYLAARGPQMLALAGEIADGVITHGTHERYLALARDRVAAGLARAGRPADAVDVALMAEVVVTDDPARERERMRGRCVVIAGGEYAPELVERYGLTPDDVDPVRRAMRAGDLAAAARAVNDRVVDAFCVVGSAEHCRGRLRRMAEAGVTHVICWFGAGAGEAEVAAALATLGRQVIAPLASA